MDVLNFIIFLYRNSCLQTHSVDPNQTPHIATTLITHVPQMGFNVIL